MIFAIQDVRVPKENVLMGEGKGLSFIFKLNTVYFDWFPTFFYYSLFFRGYFIFYSINCSIGQGFKIAMGAFDRTRPPVNTKFHIILQFLHSILLFVCLLFNRWQLELSVSRKEVPGNIILFCLILHYLKLVYCGLFQCSS